MGCPEIVRKKATGAAVVVVVIVGRTCLLLQAYEFWLGFDLMITCKQVQFANSLAILSFVAGL
jgi:hypothetical protein